MTAPVEWPEPTAEVARLVGIVGPAAALTLMERHGGTRVYVRREPEADGLIAAAIGLDAARVLAARWGSDTLMVPIGRRWRILVYKAMGLSYRQIALKANASESGVYRALARAGLTEQLSFLDD